jgi:hypothetical protein
MPTWRRAGFTGILAGAVGLALVLPGCGGGGGATTKDEKGEVKLEPIKDASGKEIKISDETALPPTK